MLPFSDSFVGADGTDLTVHNPGYENVQGSGEIESNSAVNGAAGVTSCVVWGGDVFAANQYAEATVGPMAGGQYAGVAVRGQAAASGSFVNLIGDGGVSYLTLWVLGVYTVLASGGGWAVSDRIRLEVLENYFAAYVNGVLSIGPILDVTLSLGRCGFSAYSGAAPGDAGMVDLEVGNIVSPSDGIFMPLIISGL